MLKISKENLFFWRYFFVYGLLITHLFIIVCIVAMNFLPLYFMYSFFAVMHFFVAKVWRYLFITDAYLSKDFKMIVFKNRKGEEKEFSVSQIIKCATRNGIATVVIDDSGNKLKFYFMPNSKENLKYIMPQA